MGVFIIFRKLNFPKSYSDRLALWRVGRINRYAFNYYARKCIWDYLRLLRTVSRNNRIRSRGGMASLRIYNLHVEFTDVLLKRLRDYKIEKILKWQKTNVYKN